MCKTRVAPSLINHVHASYPALSCPTPSAHVHGLIARITSYRIVSYRISPCHITAPAVRTSPTYYRSGTAQRIDFHPLANTPVTLPDNVSFVIANSLAVSAKALQPWKRYNCRAVEVRLAAQLLAKGIFGDLRTTPPTATLKQVQESAKLSLREMIALLKSDQCPLKQQPYSLQEVDAALGPSLDARSMFQDSVNAKASAAVLDNTREFELYNRALHVYMEASRVLEFEAHCRSLVSATPQLGRFLTKELGLLMSASHNSCNELFDCSCPELDQLVGICIKAGALGSRLTGAGWGGCTVSLVRTEEVEAFIEQVNQQYYQAQQPALKLPAKRGDYLFASLPCRGAAIFEPTQ